MVNAMSTLQYHFLLFLDITNGNASIMVAPGMATLASNFSGGSLSYIVI
jgi:hypothetical protein